jgi:hypothetical protein
MINWLNIAIEGLVNEQVMNLNFVCLVHGLFKDALSTVKVASRE